MTDRERARALAERLLDIAKLHRTDQAFSDLDGRWEDANKQRETAKTIEEAAALLRSLTEQEGWRPISDEAKKPWGVLLSDGFFVRVGVWHQERWADLVKLEIRTVPADLHFTPTIWQPVPSAKERRPNWAAELRANGMVEIPDHMRRGRPAPKESEQ